MSGLDELTIAVRRARAERPGVPLALATLHAVEGSSYRQPGARLLVDADGRVLAEVAPPGTRSSLHEARLELDGHLGPWFAWATVSVDDIAGLARPSGLTPARVWEDTGRWFVVLQVMGAT